MQSNKFFKWFGVLFITAALISSFQPVGAPAMVPVTGTDNVSPSTAAKPALSDFVATVENGSPSQITGVYVPQILALPVKQQPAGQPGYVPNEENVVAQFSMAAQYNTDAFIAHNHLAGALFSDLKVLQPVTLVFGDGSTRQYIISAIHAYQALSPNSPYSSFVDLNTNATLTVTDLFKEIYTISGRVIFQTCILKDGEPSWGRLFVIAEPMDDANTFSQIRSQQASLLE